MKKLITLIVFAVAFNTLMASESQQTESLFYAVKFNNLNVDSEFDYNLDFELKSKIVNFDGVLCTFVTKRVKMYDVYFRDEYQYTVYEEFSYVVNCETGELM